MTKGKKIFKSLPGMKDVFPEEAFIWEDIERISREIFAIYGYEPIRTPILEDLSLFDRTLGEETEIVKKQMFVVKREKETYCLRPEATAAVVRAYLESNLDKIKPFAKLYYIGPMFRAERPQKGRLRQFHHIGVEALGSSSPYLDSEIISLVNNLLQKIGISGYQIKINSLGCANDRRSFGKILKKKMRSSIKKLCPDCKNRFRRNIFRVLDCKNETCKQEISKLDLNHAEYLCKDCNEHFTAVKTNLNNLNVDYCCQLTLVRGLDYYTRTVFEVSHGELGAQDAIGAGGRYDDLIFQLGGPQSGAVGFALGIERLILAGNLKPKTDNLRAKVFIITMGEKAKEQGFILLNKLRSEAIISDMDYEDKSLKSQMRKANDSGAKLAVLLGENELNKQVVTIKNMQSGNQEEASLENFAQELKKRL